MPWIVWVAGYNTALPWISERLSPSGATRAAQILVFADAAALVTLVAIFPDPLPGALYAGLTLVLLEASVCWGAAGVVSTSLVVLSGPAVVDEWRCSLLHVPMQWAEILEQSLVVALLSVGLVMVNRLFAGVRALPSPAPAAPASPPVIRLSSREREVLSLMAEGCSNPMIANRLHVTESTVKRHVESILNRLNVRNRAGAVAIATRLGLLD